MKKFEIVYTYVPEPEVETGFFEVEAEDETEAMNIFERDCEDDVMDVKRVVCQGDIPDPNQMTFEV